ncbi:enoyl-CoA hydratase [Streptomyces sp. NPDC056983]|uniref:enoyl-CoA hydratase n=1 Tax=Streptomyces sp. NPDC056983 TaxID=3345987 RepID=UPI0036456222
MITTELRDTVGVITLDRHEKRNALDIEHLDALHTAVDELATTARVLVITGRGTSFCAGADLGGVHGDGFRTALYGALRAITALPVPVLAAVNGPAIGAGTQLAIACDLRVSAPSAVFAVPTARNGLAIDPWTIRRLALLAGGGPARALLLGCERIDGERALAHGLVDRLGSLDDALEWARELSGFAPGSLQYSKQALEQLFETQAGTGALEAAFDACWHSRGSATNVPISAGTPQTPGGTA